MARTTSLGLTYKGQTYREAAVALRAIAKERRVMVDRLAPVLRQAIERHLDGVIAELTRRHSGPWPGGTSQRTLSKRSGRLAEALARSRRSSGRRFRNVVGRIVIPSPYGIHEFGGTIAAEKAAFLTIPLPAALDSKGVPLKKRARDWDDTFTRTSKAGNLLIFQRRGKEIVPLYVLKRSVTVPARLGVGELLGASAEQLSNELGPLLDKTLRDLV